LADLVGKVSTSTLSLGALTALPVSRIMPQISISPSITARVRCLVHRSAGFSLPRTLKRRKVPRRRWSWTAHREVPNSSYAAPSADANRGTGVGVNRQCQRHPKIRSRGLGTETLCNSLHNTSELSLSRRQGDVLLGRGPVLDNVGAQEKHAARCGPSSLQAPREISVDIHVQVGFRLPRVLQHQARGTGQILSKSPKSLEVCPSRRAHSSAELFGRKGDVNPVHAQVVRPGRAGSE